jgi:hypothetical protein
MPKGKVGASGFKPHLTPSRFKALGLFNLQEYIF